jgi:hypothetical protein
MILIITIFILLIIIIGIYFYYNQIHIMPTNINVYNGTDKNNTLSIPFRHSF